jgi:hypothetical protein
MAGSTDEDDRTIMRLATALYKKFSLKEYITLRLHIGNRQKVMRMKNCQLSVLRTGGWQDYIKQTG